MNLINSDKIELEGIEKSDKVLPERLNHYSWQVTYLNGFSNMFGDIASISLRRRMFSGGRNSHFDQAMNCCWASYLRFPS